MRVTAEDQVWVRENYPGLEIRSSGAREIIAGIFQFTAAYNQAKKEYSINPVNIGDPKVIVIQDEYEIRLSIYPDISVLPKVYETGGRIKALAKEKGIPDIDLHIYPDDSLCLVGVLDENVAVTLPDFFDRHVLQFFYDQSYFERYGRWPRGQYSHGVLGVFENYFDMRQHSNGELIKACLNQLSKSRHWPEIRKMLLRKEAVKGHWQCPCGSRMRFRDCHAKALKGLWGLQNDFDLHEQNG